MINTDDIALQLGQTGLCVVPNFMDAKLVQAIRSDLKMLKKSGVFIRAGTGQGVNLAIRQDVRRDEIYWLDELTANLVQQQLWLKVNALKQSLNRVLYLGLREFEGHYASYPKGGFFTRHRDSFQRDHSRRVTLILYLNPLWKFHHGGHLRVYTPGKTLDIEPLGGTLVCFLSHELEHEVLLSSHRRLSFSGWFKA